MSGEGTIRDILTKPAFGRTNGLWGLTKDILVARRRPGLTFFLQQKALIAEVGDKLRSDPVAIGKIVGVGVKRPGVRAAVGVERAAEEIFP